MTGLTQKYHDSQSSKEQRSLEYWAQTREKGKARFVLRQAVALPVMMTVLRDFFGYLDGGVPILRIRFIVGWFVVGIITGFLGWSSRESKYKKALASRSSGIF
jgi:hypothetical protein